MNRNRPRNLQVSSQPYLLDNAGSEAPARFRALAELFDAGTKRHLQACGVAGGWQCLELGGGGGSIAQWLADQVGPAGRVVATDIDPRRLRALNDARIDVWCHDLTADPLPGGAFDLVHARLVVVHMPRRDEALQRIIGALKPGGWLLLEEFDSFSMPPDPRVNPAETFLKTHQALARLMVDHGFERCYGRLLFGRLRAHALDSVAAEARMFMCPGRSAGALLLRANFEQLRCKLVDGGYITQQEFERDLAALDDPDFLMPSSILWSARGRRRPG